MGRLLQVFDEPETDPPHGPGPWTDLGANAAGFAGVGTYATTVELTAAQVGGRVVPTAQATSAGCG